MSSPTEIPKPLLPCVVVNGQDPGRAALLGEVEYLLQKVFYGRVELVAYGFKGRALDNDSQLQALGNPVVSHLVGSAP